MTPVLLIASAAYAEPELVAEFGRLPPAFLPLANQRLFAHQLAALGAVPARRLLSIPEDFEPDAADLAALEAAGVELVRVPAGLRLGESIVYVLNVTASAAGALMLLHGDTLLQDYDFAAPDTLSTAAAARPGYEWGYVRADAGRLAFSAAPPEQGVPPPALSGFFHLAETSLFIQAVTRARGQFLGGLAAYSEARALALATAGRWFDFGHAGTYHLSRQALTTERAFNSLTPARRSLVKSGTPALKIAAEADWFETLPAPLRLYTPAYLGRRGDSRRGEAYEIEYLHHPTLADLFVFGRLPRAAWETIFAAADEFLSACAARPMEGSKAPLYAGKTLTRLAQFAAETGTPLDAPCRLNGAPLPSLTAIAHAAIAAIPPAPPFGLTLLHGDFCFSNILYDVRSSRIRVIDPRGLDAAQNISAAGDLRYDIGKLHHSAIGRYDSIIAGHYALARTGPLSFALALPETPTTRIVAASFAAQRFAGLSPAQAAAHPMSILLFLSMLPLHGDNPNRQAALLANALRLFAAWEAA